MWAIVVAAGTGTRFGGAKQFALLRGRPVVQWSLDTARSCCDGVVLVVAPDHLEQCRPLAPRVVAGGATRAQSVRSGLAAVPVEADVVLVHDAARPLSSPVLWAAVVEAVRAGADGAVPAVPVTDTVKQVGADGSLVTVDRSALLAVQTPQGFKSAVLRAAHAGQDEATDDAGLVEAAGGRVVSVPGEAQNLKITGPLDLVVAEGLLTAADGGPQ